MNQRSFFLPLALKGQVSLDTFTFDGLVSLKSLTLLVDRGHKSRIYGTKTTVVFKIKILINFKILKRITIE